MDKRENLLVILFPILVFAFMCISQELLLLVYRKDSIARSDLSIYLVAAQLALALLCGGISFTRRASFRFRPEKRLLLLFGILAATQCATVLALHITGERYIDSEYSTYAYLAIVLGAALTFVPQRPIRALHLVAISAGFAINWSFCLLMSTFFRLRFDSPALPPPSAFELLYLVSFISLGITVGSLAHRIVRRDRTAIPAIVISSIVAIWGGFYVFKRLVSLFSGGTVLIDSSLGAFGQFLSMLERHYYGYRQIILFLMGWHVALLLSIRKDKQATLGET